jgi:hypothetical protein
VIKLRKEKFPSSGKRRGDQPPTHIDRFPASRPNSDAKTANKTGDDDKMVARLVKTADISPTIDTAKLVSLSGKLHAKKYNIDSAGIASKILHFEAQLTSSEDE